MTAFCCCSFGGRGTFLEDTGNGSIEIGLGMGLLNPFLVDI
jgi:hypothetical protein